MRPTSNPARIPPACGPAAPRHAFGAYGFGQRQEVPTSLAGQPTINQMKQRPPQPVRFQTTSASPARSDSRQRVNPGRLLAAPLAVSVKTCPHPAFFRAASSWTALQCRSDFTAGAFTSVPVAEYRIPDRKKLWRNLGARLNSTLNRWGAWHSLAGC